MKKIIANGSASPDAGEAKKTSTAAQPKSPAKAAPAKAAPAAKKESPKKTAKVDQPKTVEVEVPKAEKKSGEQKKKEFKPVDFDDGRKNYKFHSRYDCKLELIFRRMGRSNDEEEEADRQY